MLVSREKINDMFDAMADSYDGQWANMAAINGALHLQMSGIFSSLPHNANILCVGAGTGAEILYLADKFPGWQFTAVEPSTRMLKNCRRRLELAGVDSRCTFHGGYLETLDTTTRFDGATAILVSQFILDSQQREAFFKLIASYLADKGIFICADLSATLGSDDYKSLLRAWVEMMNRAGIASANLQTMQETYASDVSLLPAQQIATMLASSGFSTAIHFYQSLLIHAWYCTKS